MFQSAELSRTSRRHPRRQRLTLEGLEQRQLLTTLVVDQSDPAAYQEIQAAVDAASPGDVIKVEAGEYDAFTVDKDNLTIREAKANSDPVVNAEGGFFAINVTADADNVTIKGLHATGAALGIFVEGSNVTLTQNSAYGNSQFGIALYGGDDSETPTVTGAVISHNSSDNNYIGFSDQNTVNTTYTGNTASGNGFIGFWTVFGQGTTYVGNRSTGNFSTDLGFCAESGGLAGVGFVDLWSQDTTLIGNHSSDDCIGMLSERSTGATFVGNTVTNSLSDGFRFQASSQLTVKGNRALGSGQNPWGDPRDGFSILGVSDAEFRGNTANGSSGHGFNVDIYRSENNNFGSSSNITFKGNHARDNSEYGVSVGPLATDIVFHGMSCDGNVLGDSDPSGIC